MNSSELDKHFKKLSILYIAPRFHPFKGGAERNMYVMASKMAEDGHDVQILTTNFRFRNEELLPEEFVDKMKIIRLRSFIQRPSYLCFIPGLLIELMKRKPDVIHMSGFGFIWFEFCLSIKRILPGKTKFINTPHGPFMATDFSETGFRSVVKRLYTKILSIILPWLYDSVIAVVEKQKVWLVDDYKIPLQKISVIPNGIDYDYIEREIPVYQQDKKIIITYLNRMEWYKGVQDVLAAIIKLKKTKSLPSFEFWIMGRPGAYTETLKKIISDNNLSEITKFIFSPSDQQRDRIFLEESQINILPSKWEATGITLIEAMAKGNVIITTNQNQAVDLLISKDSGFSYNFGDVEALTKILKKIIVDYDLRQKIIAYNLEFARLFTWEAFYPLYKELVQKLTG